MALKQCGKCSEMVDEAKAFCPGCGNAFVEEQTRTQTSSFDSADYTVQLGQTMYNQMLSDMGLHSSKAPNPGEKRVEVLSPEPSLVEPIEKAPDKTSSKAKWFIIGGILLVLIFAVLVIVAGVLFYLWPRL